MEELAELRQTRDWNAVVAILSITATLCGAFAGHDSAVGSFATGLAFFVSVVLLVRWVRAHGELKDAEQESLQRP